MKKKKKRGKETLEKNTDSKYGHEFSLYQSDN